MLQGTYIGKDIDRWGGDGDILITHGKIYKVIRVKILNKTINHYTISANDSSNWTVSSGDKDWKFEEIHLNNFDKELYDLSTLGYRSG